MSLRAIAVMAKQPIPGHSKTRLIPHLDAESAAELSRSMIVDTVTALQAREDCTTLIAADSVTAAGWFADVFPQVDILIQRGETLGERLDGVLSDLIEVGHQHAFAIGSDSPDLPHGHLTTAFAALDTDAVDVVFGPTNDGGYYLVGWKRQWSAVLREIEMSTPTVLEDSLAIAEAIGARVELAPKWYDIDDVDDLDRFRSTGGPDASASQTQQFLERVLG